MAYSMPSPGHGYMNVSMKEGFPEVVRRVALQLVLLTLRRDIRCPTLLNMSKAAVPAHLLRQMPT